jgi:hypothetical protein
MIAIRCIPDRPPLLTHIAAEMRELFDSMCEVADNCQGCHWSPPEFVGLPFS